MTKMLKIIAAFAFFAKNSCLCSEYLPSDKENLYHNDVVFLPKPTHLSSVLQGQIPGIKGHESRGACEETLNGSALSLELSFGMEVGHPSYATDWSDEECIMGYSHRSTKTTDSTSKRKRSTTEGSNVLSPINSPLSSPQKIALRSPTKKRTKFTDPSTDGGAGQEPSAKATPSAKRKLCFEGMIPEDQTDHSRPNSDAKNPVLEGLQAAASGNSKGKAKNQRTKGSSFITPEEALAKFKYNFMAHQATEKELAETYLPIPKELRGDEGTTFKPLIPGAGGNLPYQGTRAERRRWNERVPGILASPVKPYHAQKKTPAHAPKEFTVDPDRAKHTRASYALERTILWQEKSIEQVFEPLLLYLKGCSDQGASPSLMAVTEILFTKMSDYFDCKVDIEDEQFWLSSYQLTNQRNKTFLPQNLQRMSQGQNPILDGETGHAHHVTQKTLCGPGSQLKEIVIYVPESFHHEHSELLHRFLEQGEKTRIHGVWANEWNNRRKQANMELHAELSKKVGACLLPKS